MLDLAGAPRIVLVRDFDRFDRVLGVNRVVEVKEASFDFDNALALEREPLGSDVIVLRVVLASIDHLLQRLVVVDNETKELRHRALQFQNRPKCLTIRKGAELHGLREIGKVAIVQSCKVLG